MLQSPGMPDVRARLSGLRVSDGSGAFQAFGAAIVPQDQAKLRSGAAYTLMPVNTSQEYVWAVAPETKLTPDSATWLRKE